MRFSNASSSVEPPPVVLNAMINVNKGIQLENRNASREMNVQFTSANEDFFLKNENNCFYKCVLCSETIKSKPLYKTHIRTVHGTNMSKYHIQKGFVDATKEFCTEFIQTDFNIIQSLTSIFDQIDNIEKIIRDHKKRLRAIDPNHSDITDKFLKDEVLVLELYGEMIQRAFDIVSEKNELITCLQEDVHELLEREGSFDESEEEIVEEEEEIVKEEGEIFKEEEEPVYELYYIEDDDNQKECTEDFSTVDDTSTNVIPSSVTKRGRPKGDLARSLDDCLGELPEAAATYIRSSTANVDAKYQCNECDVSAKTKMLLCVHYMRVHLKQKNKICPHCNRGFASQGDLTRHIRIHSGESPFKCDYPDCTSEFKTSGDLKKHKVVHERDPSDRPFECTECESKFARQTDLTRHKKSHLIGKVENIGFTCELCNKVFYRKDLFRSHSNHHLKIKPFECSHCLKRFAKKYDLLKHIEKLHKNVNCDECGESFDARSKLVQHYSKGLCTVIKTEPRRIS